ncbi:MAG: hemolysin III family protein [Planctomycetaceae bacterium]|nr:hemolysin III family protein [Planctomycetaceae bacterium]
MDQALIDDIAVFPLPGCREPLSSLSHMLGAFVFAAMAILLIRRGRGDWVRTGSLVVMAASSVLLLILSSAYHLTWPGPVRDFLLRADVAGIFLLIAGSMTPVHAILFSGRSRWIALVLIWTTAVLGILLRMIYHEFVTDAVGVSIFLLCGWGSLVTAIILWRRYGWGFIKPAVFAGASYTLGAIVLLLHGPTLVHGVLGPHELWHFAVLCGLSMHWRFVFQFASGPDSTLAAS